MPYFAYSVHDNETGEFDPPYFAQSDEQAKAFYKDFFDFTFHHHSPTVRSLLNKLSLYKIGDWHTKSGSVRRIPDKIVCSIPQLFGSQNV